jgi:hypothetical protein
MNVQGPRIACALVAALLAGACAGHPPVARDAFAIYPLADTTVTIDEAAGADLSSLELAAMPVLSARDLEWYRWPSHVFAVKPDARSRLERRFGGRGPRGVVPFVVVAGGERRYLGAFWPMWSSLLPYVPHLSIPLGQPLRMAAPGPIGQVPDPRGKEEIRRSLEAAGLLEEGD